MALIEDPPKLQVMEPHLQECVDVTCCAKVGQSNKCVLEGEVSDTGRGSEVKSRQDNQILLICRGLQTDLISAFGIWVIDVVERVLIDLPEPGLFTNTHEAVGISFAISSVNVNAAD